MADEPTPDPIDGTPEVVTPEVVQPGDEHQAPGGAMVPASSEQAYSALERAAEAALALPGLAGRDEFLSLAAQARLLSLSAGAPQAVRDNPHLAFHLAMIGRDLGISPTAALQLVDVIGYNAYATSYAERYKNVQLSISPELLNGQINRLGLGRIAKVRSSTESCTAVALAPGGHLDPRCSDLWPHHVTDDTPGGPCTCTLPLILGYTTFTWQDAQEAQLASWDCRPGEHSEKCKAKSRDDSCRQGYKTYPQRMLWWRAAGWCQSDNFPSASIGLYSPEELGAIVDEEGRAIDPASVELPDGYEPVAAPPNPADELLAEKDADAHADLQRRIDAIGAAQAKVPVPSGDEVATGPRLALLELWSERDEHDVPRLPPMRLLAVRHNTKAKALVASIEARIKRGDWGDEVRETWAAAIAPPAEPQEAQDDAAGADAQEEGEPAADAPGPQEATETAESEEDRRQREAVEQYERDVAAPSKHLAPPPEPPTREELGVRIAQEVSKMEPTDLLAKLGELLPEGEAVPRTKDARLVRLTDLLVDQALADQEAATAPPAADELPLDGSDDDQTLG